MKKHQEQKSKSAPEKRPATDKEVKKAVDDIMVKYAEAIKRLADR